MEWMLYPVLVKKFGEDLQVNLGYSLDEIKNWLVGPELTLGLAIYGKYGKMLMRSIPDNWFANHAEHN